nr:hypothetical protein [Tanacetum cinerariifolium]
MRCETKFWDILYPGGEKFDYVDQRKLKGYHINAFIELMMRKRPLNAQWTLGLSELVSFHIDSGKSMSILSVVDAFRATIDGTNPLYSSWEVKGEDMYNIMKKISDVAGVVENIELNDFFCYLQKPNCDLNTGLQQLWTEEDYMDLYMYIGHEKLQFLHIYIVKEEINEECEACRASSSA